MSGVLGHKFGRRYSRTSVRVSSVKYSVSSHFVLRHVKYVYDCENPNFARRYITCGLVKASAKNNTSGCSALISLITHSQKAKGFVWGLSTRKMRTPRPIQKRKADFNSSHRARQSLVSKSSG